jgi:hypothetical protein
VRIAVDAIGLNVRDIRETVRACAHVRVPDAVPSYLQKFLVLRLQTRAPDVAAKVAGLSTNRSSELFRLIRALQRDGRSA